MRALAATMRNAFAELAANPRALAAQMAVMIVNNCVWVLFWLLFFHRVGAVRGWDADGVLLLFAVITASAGLTLGVLANARSIGPMAAGGELDATLALPVSPLPFLLVRRVEAVHLGDVVFGVTLFAVAGAPTPTRVLVYAAAVLTSTVLLTGFLVLAGSSAFFVGRNEGGELGFYAVIMLGSYPVDVFAGAAKIALYTVVPAAFVASVPARLVQHFEPRWAGGLLGAALVFAVAGWVAFARGLRRYTSGSVWVRA